LGYLHCSCIGSGTKTPATHFDASAGDSAGSDAGATADAGSGAGSNSGAKQTQVSTQVRKSVQVKVGAIACLHEQKSADIHTAGELKANSEPPSAKTVVSTMALCRFVGEAQIP
jgi:hypothetical protein